MKICTKCKLEKPKSEYHSNKWQTDGLSHYCKTCKSIRAKEYNATHQDIEKSRKERWYKDNRDYSDKKTKTWVENNPEARAKISQKYYKNNRDKSFAWAASYRASKFDATPNWANQRNIECIYEHARLISIETGQKMSVDHIVPLNSKVVCGLHWEGNLQILPMRENIIKGNRIWPDMPG